MTCCGIHAQEFAEGDADILAPEFPERLSLDDVSWARANEKISITNHRAIPITALLIMPPSLVFVYQSVGPVGFDRFVTRRPEPRDTGVTVVSVAGIASGRMEWTIVVCVQIFQPSITECLQGPRRKNILGV